MMSYIRRLLSEQILSDGRIIRRYEVEIPRHLHWQNYRLLTMELQLSPGAAWYYSDTPWTLANQMWSVYCSHDRFQDHLYGAFMPYHAEDPEAWVVSCDGAIGIEVTTDWDYIASPPKWPLERIIKLVESWPENKIRIHPYSALDAIKKIDDQSSNGS
jgi:hypothetical protein